MRRCLNRQGNRYVERLLQFIVCFLIAPSNTCCRSTKICDLSIWFATQLRWTGLIYQCLLWGSLSLCDVQKYLSVQNYSYYLRILKKYLKYVAPENLFLGFYEDILFHPNRFLAAVQEFLDVPVEDIGSKPQRTGGYKGINTEYAVYLAQRNIRKIEEMASVFGGYAQFWLDVASELCQTDTTIHSDETFLSTPFATNDLWSSRWECSGAKDFQSGPLSSLSCVNKLIP